MRWKLLQLLLSRTDTGTVHVLIKDIKKIDIKVPVKMEHPSEVYINCKQENVTIKVQRGLYCFHVSFDNLEGGSVSFDWIAH